MVSGNKPRETIFMTTPAAAAPLPPRRVLLLDDDRFMLDMLTDMLAGCGRLEVFAEADARAALATLATHAPDILICDLALPDMDGVEFLQAAASRGYAGGVVLLSGMDAGVRDAAGELARALGLRVLGVFRKPIGAAQLHALLAD
jgi:CheY-like chemotaxis protein